MGTDEIGYQLITQSGCGTDMVEVLLGAFEEVERGLAHVSQHPFGGVLGRHL